MKQTGPGDDNPRRLFSTGGGTAIELLERTPQLEALDAWLREAATGSGRLVFVGGEAGVGKSTLIDRFCELARGRVRVLRGVCDALSTPRPLGPLFDIAASVGGELDRLLREDAPRDRVFRAALAELNNGSIPTVMVIEDIQWADQATIDLLRFLGRRLDLARALLLVTYRDDEGGPNHPVRVVLGDLATTATTRRLRLEPLSEAGIQALIALDARGNRFDPASLHRLTGGNPFFASEVLACDIASGAIPATIRDAVLARASRLSPDGREILDAAAVFDAPVPANVLIHVAGSTPAAVDACLAGGMLVAVDDRLVAFRNELARTAIYDAISPPRRHELHARVLALLQSTPDSGRDWSLLACHAEAAGDGAVVLYAAQEAARRAVSLRAHREAVAQYARALRFATDVPSEERAELLEALSYECYLTGAFAAAIQHRREALFIWRESGDRRREGDALRWISRFSWFAGRTGDAVAAAEDALAVLSSLPPGRELAMAMSNRAQLYMLEDENDRAIVWGQQAIALAKILGETEIHLHALTNVGNARMRLEHERGRMELEQSLAMARNADLEEHVARALNNLGCNTLHARELPQSADYFAEGIAYTTDHDLDSWRLEMLAWRGCLRMLEGDWAIAVEDATAVLESPNPAPVSRIPALTVRGLVRARLGAPDAAESLAEACALAELIGEIQRLRPVRVARAEAAWLAGDASSAVAELRAVLDMTLQRGSSWDIGEVLVWLARLDSPAPFDTIIRAAGAASPGVDRRLGGSCRRLGGARLPV